MLSGVGTVAHTRHKRALIQSHAPTLDDSIRFEAMASAALANGNPPF
jgi:hypothetical protein